MADYIHGIDVSQYQGVVDWALVAKTQRFAFIRLGYINREGTITIDPYFQTNMTAAIAAGLQVGIYLYSYVRSADAARIAANKAMELVEPYGIRMPIAFDFEHAALYQTYSKQTNAEICNAFLQTVKNGGYTPVIYTYYSFAKSWVDLNAVEAPRWLANYTGKIGIDGVDIWQYSSSGSVNGIAGRVDMNRAYNGFWDRYPNRPVEPVWEPLTDKVLEVYGTRNCEYFNSVNVNDVAGKLTPGQRYPVLGILDGVFGGYNWATIQLDGHEYYVALLDDRCRITEAPDCDEHEAEIKRLTDALAAANSAKDKLAAECADLLAKVKAARAALEV